MTLLIGQMVGCLIVAAGIGGVVGWLLRQLSTGQLTQQSMDITAALRLKEQLLEKAQHQLKVQTAEMELLESKVVESEENNQSGLRDLSARNDRIEALQDELAARTKRLTALESDIASLRQRIGEYDAAIAARSDETQQLQSTRREIQQTYESN